MDLQNKFRRLGLVTLVAIVLLAGPALLAQKKKGDKTDKQTLPDAPAVIWREPADIATRDLFLGPGGEAMRPDLSHVTFIKQEVGGHTTKYRVRDGRGMEWVVKLGNEAQSETASSRLVWAAGYYTDITYFVPEVDVEGKGRLKNVRFEARPKEIKRYDVEWDWDDNPFRGTPELQGLKVMAVLLNDWDLKTQNNRVLFVRDDSSATGELRYIISDLGATLGKTGNNITHNRNQPRDYAHGRLIKKVEGQKVLFDFHATHHQMLDSLTVADAKWLGRILSQLSDQQISDAFRAAGYSPEDIQLLTASFKERVSELVNLPG